MIVSSFIPSLSSANDYMPGINNIKVCPLLCLWAFLKGLNYYEEDIFLKNSLKKHLKIKSDEDFFGPKNHFETTQKNFTISFFRCFSSF